MKRFFNILVVAIGFLIPCYLQGGVDVMPIQNFEKRIDGLLKVDLNQLPLPSDFLNLQQVMIYIPPTRLGGNHIHPRREIFISLSDDVELHWVDEDGVTHRHQMKEGNQLYLFDVQPFVPHAIVNFSPHSAAVILEFTDEDQHDVEPYLVIREPICIY